MLDILGLYLFQLWYFVSCLLVIVMFIILIFSFFYESDKRINLFISIIVFGLILFGLKILFIDSIIYIKKIHNEKMKNEKENFLKNKQLKKEKKETFILYCQEQGGKYGELNKSCFIGNNEAKNLKEIEKYYLLKN